MLKPSITYIKNGKEVNVTPTSKKQDFMKETKGVIDNISCRRYLVNHLVERITFNNYTFTSDIASFWVDNPNTILVFNNCRFSFTDYLCFHKGEVTLNNCTFFHACKLEGEQLETFSIFFKEKQYISKQVEEVKINFNFDSFTIRANETLLKNIEMSSWPEYIDLNSNKSTIENSHLNSRLRFGDDSNQLILENSVINVKESQFVLPQKQLVLKNSLIRGQEIVTKDGIYKLSFSDADIVTDKTEMGHLFLRKKPFRLEKS